MQIQPTVTGRRMRITEAIDRDVRARLRKLSTFAPSIITARVVVELAERHQRAGHRCDVHITLVLPEGDVVVTHQPSAHLGRRGAMKTRKTDQVEVAHKDVKVAIADAFAAARRRLQDHVRRQRGDVKRHVPVGSAAAAGGRRLMP